MLWGIKRNLFHHLLNDRMESSCSEILCVSVHLECLFSNFLYRLYSIICTSSVKTRFTFSASINFCCCKIKLYCGSFRILTSSTLLIVDRFTRIGSLPNSYGIKSYTFAIEKDPLAINKI